MSKSEIRATYRKIRQTILPEDRLSASQSAVEYLEREPLFQASQQIACYLSTNEEFDSRQIIEKILEHKKNCYLPILTEEKALKFVRYCDGDALELNRYSIPEPINTSRKIEVSQLDLIILPLIAFDHEGHRLGTGGGYYDRTLACLHHEEDRKPFILGLGYSSQQTSELPSDPWDVVMDGVLTEKGWLRTR